MTGLPLDPQLVASGEKDELDRFRKMGVYSYVPKEHAEQDMEGTFVRTKWVRIDKGTPASPKVRCRLVAQGLGFGERMDELFAGTPSLSAVKMALANASIKGKRIVCAGKAEDLHRPSIERPQVQQWSCRSVPTAVGRRGEEEDDSHGVHFEYIAALRVLPQRERHYGRECTWTIS